MEKNCLIGIDIGGTKCAVTLACHNRETGHIDFLAKRQIPTGAGPEKTIAALKTEIDGILNERVRPGLKAFGISCGGPLDSRSGRVLSPPNLTGWDDVPIVKEFETHLGIPGVLQNDADACALAEWQFGAGRGCEEMIFLTCGTGMGAGLILGGRLHTGKSSMAGEIGHMRMESFGPVGYGKKGSFEGFCSGAGIAKLGRFRLEEELQMGRRPFLLEKYSLEEISTKALALAAEEGDSLALEVFETSGHYLGKGLSVLIDLLNPQKIIIGGVFMRAGRLLRPAMESVIEKEALERSRSACRIEAAGLGEGVGDYAAVAAALYSLECLNP